MRRRDALGGDARSYVPVHHRDRLAAGEPVLMQTYRLPHRLRPPSLFFWCLVHPDGHLEPVTRPAAEQILSR